MKWPDISLRDFLNKLNIIDEVQRICPEGRLIISNVFCNVHQEFVKRLGHCQHFKYLIYLIY